MTAAKMLDNYFRLGNERAEVRYVEGERRFAEETFEALTDALSAVTSYFELPPPFRKVRAVLAPEEQARSLGRRWRTWLVGAGRLTRQPGEPGSGRRR